MRTTDSPRELFAQQAETLKKSLETARFYYETELRRYRDGISGRGDAAEVARHQFWACVTIARNLGFNLDLNGVTMDVYSVTPGPVIEQSVEDWGEGWQGV